MNAGKQKLFALWLIASLAQTAIAGRWTQLLPFENVVKVRYNHATQIYWFGTSDNGLWRFDGRAFKRILPETKNCGTETIITALEIDETSDTLWVGTPSGLFGYHDLSQTWVCYGGRHITALLVDASGVLWYGTNEGEVGKRNNSRLDSLGNAGKSRIRCLAQQGADQIYIGTNDKGLYFYECRNVKSCSLSALTYSNLDPVIQAIAIDRHSNKWLGTRKGVYRLDSQDSLRHFTTEDGLANNSVNAIWIEAYQNDDEKWFGTNNGVSVLDSANALWRTYKVQNSGLANNEVIDMIGDGDGNLLFAFQDFRGVSKLDNNWSELTMADCFKTNCLRSDFVRAIEHDRSGRLWTGTDAGEAEILVHGKWKRVQLDDDSCLEPPATVSDFLPDRDGMWIATAGCGIFKVVEADILDSFMVNDKIRSEDMPLFPSNRVYALARSENNDTLWAGTYAGLARIVIRPTIEVDKVFLESSNVTSLAYDRQDRLWIGTNQGVLIYDRGRLRSQPIAQLGPDAVAINTIARDSSGAMWIGTNAGVARFDQSGQLTTFTSREGLPDNRIFNLGVAPNDTVWCGTVNGAAAFDGEKWTAYTIEDGLSDNFIRQIAFGPGKVVWFATYGGGISRYRRTPIGPNTYIENVFSIVTESNATFRYSGSDFNTPLLNLRYQYALDDFRNWSPITPAPFVTLPIEKDGSHIFYVRAVDKDGNVDLLPAMLRFSKVRPEQGGAFVDSTDVQKFGSLWLYVPPNVLKPGVTIVATPIDTTANVENLRFTGIAYRLSPVEAFRTDKKPLTMTIFYKDVLKAKTFAARRLAIFRADNSGEWRLIGGSIDSVRGTITTTITQLGLFGLFENREDREEISSAEALANLAAQPRILSPQGGGYAPNVTISFDLGQSTDVTAKVYNLAGRLVSVLCENRLMPTGRNAIDWDGRDYYRTICPSGLYLVTIEAAGRLAKKTVMVLNE